MKVLLKKLGYKQQQGNYPTSLITRSNRTSFGFLAAWLIINLFIINNFLYMEKRKIEKLSSVSFTFSLQITGKAKLKEKKKCCCALLCFVCHSSNSSSSTYPPISHPLYWQQREDSKWCHASADTKKEKKEQQMSYITLNKAFQKCY